MNETFLKYGIKSILPNTCHIHYTRDTLTVISVINPSPADIFVEEYWQYLSVSVPSPDWELSPSGSELHNNILTVISLTQETIYIHNDDTYSYIYITDDAGQSRKDPII